jgi:RHS repeat-associated protein
VYFDDVNISFTPSAVVQMEDFYPFGLKFNSYIREKSVLNTLKLFQNQEHIDDLGLNWDSFKWRNHQPDIGRFFNVDPLSEKYYYNSPYAFSENKVVAHVELEGLESASFMIKGKEKTLGYEQDGFKGSVKFGDGKVEVSGSTELPVELPGGTKIEVEVSVTTANGTTDIKPSASTDQKSAAPTTVKFDQSGMQKNIQKNADLAPKVRNMSPEKKADPTLKAEQIKKVDHETQKTKMIDKDKKVQEAETRANANKTA